MLSFEGLVHQLASFDLETISTNPQKEATRFRKPLFRAKRDNFRKAAVLVLIYPSALDSRPRIVFMKRKSSDNDPHSGQISFPGGGLEAVDRNDLWQCALRELEEEVGLSTRLIKQLFPLSSIPVDVSQFMVFPFLAYATSDLHFSPCDDEVERVITFPLDLILESARQKQMTKTLPNGSTVSLDYFDLGYEKIWGATGAILDEVKSVLQHLTEAS